MNSRTDGLRSKSEPEPVAAVTFYSFSGAVLGMPRTDFSLESLTWKGRRIDIFPPGRAAPPNWRPIPQLTQENIKRFVHGIPDNWPSMKMAIAPGITDSGDPTLIYLLGDDIDDSIQLPFDTIVAIIHGPKCMDVCTDVLEDFLRYAFEWVRIETKQWWAGFPSEPITGNAHTVIPLLSENQADLPVLRGRQTTAIAGTKRLTGSVWSEIVDRLRQGKHPEPSVSLAWEALYLMNTGPMRSGVVLLTSALEMARDSVLERSGLDKRALKARRSDLPKHLSLDFDGLFGRNLSMEEPDLFKALGALWKMRGNVAHGNVIQWRGREVTSRRADKVAHELFSIGHNVLDWMRSI